jgi:DNA gyrase subunit B
MKEINKNIKRKILNTNYDASNIQKLENLSAIRTRPDMYIGNIREEGLHHCVFEILDNSIDEVLSGYCNLITIEINQDESISILDNGRGIPVDIHPKYGISALEIVLTKLHSGGKFGKNIYKVSGGLHGVGIKCVNALSKHFQVEVFRNGKIYQMKFSYGKRVQKLKIIGKTKKTGTKVSFLPDPKIFSEIKIFNYERILKRVRELAFLNSNISIKLKDKRTNRSNSFSFKNGIIGYISYLNKNKKNNFPKNPIYFCGKESLSNSSKGKNKKIDNSKVEDIYIEVAMQYNSNSYSKDKMYSYANSIFNIEGGTHLSGFKSSLTRSINFYAKNNNIFKNNKNNTIIGEDVREGLTSIISIKIPNPRFEGQTKTKLSNNEVDGIIQKFLGEKIRMYLETNPKIAKKIINKAIQSSKAREASKKIREIIRKSSSSLIGSLPETLADCTEKDPNLRELFLVEGSSAGGSAKQGRNRNCQAVLPLRGKLLNIEKAGFDKILNNKEIQCLIKTIGAGIKEGIASIDIKKIRYHKIIIMTDADIDGAHINTLLLTFFFRQMKPLINKGYIYISRPPLYRIRAVGIKSDIYFWDKKSLEDYFFKKKYFEIRLKNKENKKFLSKIKLKLLLNHFKKIESIFFKFFRAKKYPINFGINIFNFFIGFIKDCRNYMGYKKNKQLILDINCVKDKKMIFVLSIKNDFLNKLIYQKLIKVDKKVLKKNKKSFLNFIENLENIKEIKIGGILDSFQKLQNEELGKIDDYFFIENKKRYSSSLKDKIVGSGNIFNLFRFVSKESKKKILFIQRYKGLGEMNPKQLYSTTMNPKNRNLLKIKIKNDDDTNNIFSILMGEEVDQRKKFIFENALSTSINLDL